MTSVPSVPGKDVIKALQKAGFELVRIKGSHHRLRNPDPDGHDVTVPVHAERDVPKGTLRQILVDAGLTVEDLRALL
ncbi:type II toxin-antitoxin system HicA family toxin [Protofrankia symbiont of Coriaria ruscifolia]|uniref:type II toxin-antitoxin system HicA family toxin n=1 Tax=Protofrankia symbiont of Coriaria ruscifolia TaxID=1306542 RepID=UPI001041961E|nr:type II toxin-antitoxin system HicA family toxin [Protofrankia symbiont of Coriaria ruscifolia]